jgi:hypothetical protein
MNRVYRGSYTQQGYGLGGSFKRFFKWIMPLVKPALTHVGNKALNVVGDIAKDVAVGKTLQESAGTHINTAVTELKNDIEKKLRGNGKRKKRKYKDIFSK